MQHDFNSLETEDLKALYDKHLEIMECKLLQGAAWKDLQDDRFTITKMGMELHRRAYPAQAINFEEIKIRLNL
jgi:hypothetical protein